MNTDQILADDAVKSSNSIPDPPKVEELKSMQEQETPKNVSLSMGMMRTDFPEFREEIPHTLKLLHAGVSNQLLLLEHSLGVLPDPDENPKVRIYGHIRTIIAFEKMLRGVLRTPKAEYITRYNTKITPPTAAGLDYEKFSASIPNEMKLTLNDIQSNVDVYLSRVLQLKVSPTDPGYKKLVPRFVTKPLMDHIREMSSLMERTMLSRDYEETIAILKFILAVDDVGVIDPTVNKDPFFVRRLVEGDSRYFAGLVLRNQIMLNEYIPFCLTRAREYATIAAREPRELINQITSFSSSTSNAITTAMQWVATLNADKGNEFVTILAIKRLFAARLYIDLDFDSTQFTIEGMASFFMMHLLPLGTYAPQTVVRLTNLALSRLFWPIIQKEKGGIFSVTPVDYAAIRTAIDRNRENIELGTYDLLRETFALWPEIITNYCMHAWSDFLSDPGGRGDPADPNTRAGDIVWRCPQVKVWIQRAKYSDQATEANVSTANYFGSGQVNQFVHNGPYPISDEDTSRLDCFKLLDAMTTAIMNTKVRLFNEVDSRNYSKFLALLQTMRASGTHHRFMIQQVDWICSALSVLPREPPLRYVYADNDFDIVLARPISGPRRYERLYQIPGYRDLSPFTELPINDGLVNGGYCLSRNFGLKVDFTSALASLLLLKWGDHRQKLRPKMDLLEEALAMRYQAQKWCCMYNLLNRPQGVKSPENLSPVIFNYTLASPVFPNRKFGYKSKLMSIENLFPIGGWMSKVIATLDTHNEVEVASFYVPEIIQENILRVVPERPGQVNKILLISSDQFDKKDYYSQAFYRTAHFIARYPALFNVTSDIAIMRPGTTENRIASSPFNTCNFHLPFGGQRKSEDVEMPIQRRAQLMITNVVGSGGESPAEHGTSVEALAVIAKSGIPNEISNALRGNIRITPEYAIMSDITYTDGVYSNKTIELAARPRLLSNAPPPITFKFYNVLSVNRMALFYDNLHLLFNSLSVTARTSITALINGFTISGWTTYSAAIVQKLQSDLEPLDGIKFDADSFAPMLPKIKLEFMDVANVMDRKLSFDDGKRSGNCVGTNLMPNNLALVHFTDNQRTIIDIFDSLLIESDDYMDDLSIVTIRTGEVKTYKSITLISNTLGPLV